MGSDSVSAFELSARRLSGRQGHNTLACKRPEKCNHKKRRHRYHLPSILTIAMAATIHQVFHLPAFWGMMLELELFIFTPVI